jgi:ABC-type amino acid transport substrate-binding protein
VRAIARVALLPASILGLSALASVAAAGDPIGILVLKEHGVGSAAQAQPYVDKFIAMAAKQSGWADAKGQYHTTRGQAEPWIQAQKPHFGILSFGAFLGLKDKHNLEVIGQVSVARAGGQQYHLVSKSAADAAGCKGKRVATDHGDDPKFIDNVIFGGKFKLADFTLVSTQRPLQTIKKVIGGEADCALIDDAQLEEMGHIDEAKGLKSVWKSDKLPSMVVVAFPAAPAAERKAFQGSFAKICEGDGKTACGEVGIQSLKAASASDYATLVTAYGK